MILSRGETSYCRHHSNMTEIHDPPRGRPRDPGIDEAILQAARDLLVEVGYTRLTIEGLSGRAGTAKSNVYRRWPRKGALVIAAAKESISIGTVPDTGDTRADLSAAIRQLITTFSDQIAGIVIFAAIANLDDDPAMALTLRDEYIYPWRESALQAIQRGIERGDLPSDTDPLFMLDLIVGVVFQRTLTIVEPMVENLEELILKTVLVRE